SWSVPSHGARGLDERGARGERGREEEPQRGEAGGRQIDDVVEPRRRPAEGGVALVLVADHTVGGVDRLIERPAGQPAERGPEDGRDDAVGEVLGEAFDRRARDAG